MSLKTFFLITYLLLSFTTSLRLVPAPVNPLQMWGDSNYASSPQNVVVSFSFPSAYAGTLGPNIAASNGLTYHQFLAVMFPIPLGPTDLLFDVAVSGTTPKFGCTLTDNTGGSYVVTPVMPMTAENSIAYCRLDDITNSPLKVGPQLVYSLTINMNLVKIASTNFLRAVGVFTSTSATPNKMILDSLPIIGTMAQYADWHTVNSIASFTATPTTANSGTIYPNTAFSLTVVVKLTATVQIANYIIVFRYPASITGPTSVTTAAMSATDLTQAALAGTLTIGAFDTNTFMISGITDTTLVNGRSFQLVLNGWKALDTNVGVASVLELIIYYKNTYSVFAYSSLNTFTIANQSLGLAVNHPEYWDIFRNGAWPLTFTITPTLADISTQGYIVIQHTNAIDSGALAGNKISFVASTCDFSGYDTSGAGTYDAFGVRPNCFALQMENGPYANASATGAAGYPGSGIFYKITNTLTAGKTYVLTVWVFADNCGGGTTANTNWALTAAPLTFTQPQFTISIYKKISVVQMNLLRFTATDIIGTATALFGQKCWNNYLSSTAVVYPQSFTTADYTPGTIAIPGTPVPVGATDTLPQTAKAANFLYKEFTYWSAGVLTSTNLVTTGTACTTATWECIASATNGFTTGTPNTGFIYGTSPLLASYFNIRTSRQRTNAAADTVANYYPVPINGVTLASSAFFSGKIVYQVPNAWFGAGDGALSCYASWSNGATQAAVGTPDTTLKQTALIVAPNAAAQPALSNYFAGNTWLSSTTVTTPQIDTTNSNLAITAPVVGSPVRLVSIIQAGGTYAAQTAAGFQFMGDALRVIANVTNTTTMMNIAFFSTCFKWKVPTIIKSLYTYIDIQIQFHYQPTSMAPNLPISNARFIKLYPEGGIFFDMSAAGTRNPTTYPTANPYINHQTIVAPGFTNYAVCLVEISAAALQAAAAGDTISNVLGIWLFGGVLMETDYNDASSTYPVGNVIMSSATYSMQSAFPMNPVDNCYINNATASTQNYLNNIINFSAGTGAALASLRSGYFFMMGSTLLITGLSSGVVSAAGATTLNVLIPYYCPVTLGATNYTVGSTVNQNLNSWPIIRAAWMTQPSFSSVTSVNKIVQWKDGASNIYDVIVPSIMTGVNLGKQGDSSSNGYANFLVSLRWAAYGSASSVATNMLYLNFGALDKTYVATGGGAGAAVSCSGITMFMTNQIIWDITVTAPVFSSTSQNGVFKTTKQFYVNGVPFNYAALGGTSTMAFPLTAFDGVTPSGNTYLGLLRPTVDVMITNYGLIDKLAFYCTSSASTSNIIVTNYNAADYNFYLDWFPLPPAQGVWATPLPAWDKITENYMNDQAGNFKLTITAPNNLPIGSSIIFTSTTGFTANTMCGMFVTGSLIYQDCVNTASSISCNVAVAGSAAFNICCYSVTLAEPTGLSSLSVQFPINTNYLPAHVSSVNFNASSIIGLAVNSNFNFATGNANNGATPKSNALSSVTYSQVSQDSGYGKATFTITFYRDVTRDSIIGIAGDLTAMQIAGTTPRCLATFSSVGQFGATWESGDAIIDQCVINLSSTTLPVSIITKKEIYKCGVIFNSRTLYVSLWPVQQVNYSLSTVTTTYKVNLNLNSGTGINLSAIAATGAALTVTGTVLTTKPVASTADSLCQVSQIFPNIVGEQSDYNFDFDLDSSKALLATSTANEFTIFWPYIWYGSYIPNVICQYASVMINCSFTDEGILNIRYPSNFPIGSGKKITIVVSSVFNPGIDVATYSFPCTVNNVNFATGVRTNLLVGSGKILTLPTFPASTNIGALRFINIDPNTVSDFTPRGISTHTFRIAYDNLLSAQPVTSFANAVIHAYFPSDYNLFLYVTTKPTAIVNEYTADVNSNITKTNTFTPTSVSLMGNRVTMLLPVATYAFPANWRYWDIVISNVTNPADTTAQTLATAPITQSTRPYSVTITNDVQTIMYRTNLNLNTYTSTPNTITPLSIYLSNNRGNVFAFNGTKWAIDIYTIQANLNVLNVKTGRYIMSYFNVKASTSNTLLPSFNTLSLTDPTFKTSLGSYNVSTSYMQTVSFYIGVACGTAPGAYIINFTASDVTTFTPLVPVVVTVDNLKPATISTNPAPVVPAAGSAWIGYILSDVNFEALTVTWVPGDNNKNDSTAAFTSVIIPTATMTPASVNASVMYPVLSTFSVTSVSTTLSAQTFKTSDPTLCFTFSGTTTISFTVSGAIAIITPTLALTSAFVYANGDTDSTLMKNQIRFTFTTPSLFPAYIYCALVCFNNSYPADADIKIPKVPSTGIIQFYSNMIATSNAINIIFSNLVRGQQYHMRCIFESTNGDPTQRTPASINFESYTAVGANASAIIAPSVAVATQCANFQFTADPGMTTRRAIVNFCQKTYSAPGYFLNGCVYCSFNDLSYILPGLSIPTNITCSATGNKNRLRFLQSASTIVVTNSSVATPVVALNNTLVSVCPVPSVICPTDPTQGGKLYTDYYNLLTTGLNTVAAFNSVLGIASVPLYTATPFLTVTDAVIPNLSTFMVTIGTYSALGNVAWTATFPSAINCKWQISATTTAPTFSSIWVCADPSWCGATRINSSVQNYQTSASTLKAFTAGTTYIIYYVCYNDIPGAQKQSIVQNSGTFTIPAAATSASTASTAVTPTINSCFLNMSILVLIMIIGLLL